MHTGRQFACTLLMSLGSGFHGTSPFSQGIALKTPGKHKAIIYMCTTQGIFTKSRSYDHDLFLNTFSEACNNSSKASLAPRVRNSSIDGNTDLRAGETTNNRYFAAFPRRVTQKPRRGLVSWETVVLRRQGSGNKFSILKMLKNK